MYGNEIAVKYSGKPTKLILLETNQNVSFRLVLEVSFLNLFETIYFQRYKIGYPALVGYVKFIHLN